MHKRHIRGEENQVHKRIYKAALNLAREYYCVNRLKRKDVRPTKLIDFEGIAKQHNVNHVI